MTKRTILPDLINEWCDEYSEEEFLEQFMPAWTFGQIIWFMYEVGEIPNTVIEEFLNEGDE